MTDIKKAATRYAELGAASDSDPRWGLRQDEFISGLRGQQGMRRLRELRENDAIIGAILTAMDMMIRSVKWTVEGGSEDAKSLVEDAMNSLDDTSWEDFVSDVLSMLPYGFSLFEMVAKRRAEDGVILFKKLAPRAQWTIDSFDTDGRSPIKGVWQTTYLNSVYIPYSRLLHFRTTANNGAPEGRSVLRSAYTSWYYANNIKAIEAVSIERELNGLPIARIPSEYMSANASDAQKAFFNTIKQAVRDVKRNEQGSLVLPSDLWEDEDGKKTTKYLVEFSLVASQGTRDIDTGKTISRYQLDMARSAMADFIMLGGGERGSYAMSASKSELFLRALEGYLNTIASTLNRKFVGTLWDWNGRTDEKPVIKHSPVSSIDLDVLGQFVQRMSLSGLDLFPDSAAEGFMREAAGIPPRKDPLPAHLDPMTPPPSPQDPAAPTAPAANGRETRATRQGEAVNAPLRAEQQP